MNKIEFIKNFKVSNPASVAFTVISVLGGASAAYNDLKKTRKVDELIKKVDELTKKS